MNRALIKIETVFRRTCLTLAICVLAGTGAYAETGITQEMIDIAKNAGFEHVEYAPVDTHFLYILIEDVECQPPIMTGVTVHRMYSKEKIGAILTYPDAVCSNIGCTYQVPPFSGKAGGGAAGAGECKKALE